MKDINLYFVRHGQTEWNLASRLQGSHNSPLTSKGVSEAKLTGRYLRDIVFAKAYSSQQPRAIETRDYILNEQNSPIDASARYIVPELTEMDYGKWEGQLIPELKNTAEFNLFLNEPAFFDGNINGGENYINVLVRMQKAINDIINQSPERGNILIVSHGNALRLILCFLSGKDWKKHRDQDYFPKINNSSVSILNYQQEDNDSTGRFIVKAINNIKHLNLSD
ncbi:hypothetical protein A9G11_12270 [Gilliamella sp. wkB108]|uniref:histidine phosphatase family protein n=1 Tax=Gilliamella sp. wkB108 TaxID=3120256 RepID=UPI00080E466C|nr:histidine phosphatase family protein [Gilliamella apicola]OCG27864.1 hypothetical protein A9G11_12270 [Gilliamella apicola]